MYQPLNLSVHETETNSNYMPRKKQTSSKDDDKISLSPSEMAEKGLKPGKKKAFKIKSLT